MMLGRRAKRDAARERYARAQRAADPSWRPPLEQGEPMRPMNVIRGEYRSWDDEPLPTLRIEELPSVSLEEKS